MPSFKEALAARKAAAGGAAPEAPKTQPVNPPEADKVLEEQTAPEVAGEPEPKAAEPEKKPKGRKPRAGSSEPDAAPAAPADTAAGAEGLRAFTVEQLCTDLAARGFVVTLRTVTPSEMRGEA